MRSLACPPIKSLLASPPGPFRTLIVGGLSGLISSPGRSINRLVLGNAWSASADSARCLAAVWELGHHGRTSISGSSIDCHGKRRGGEIYRIVLIRELLDHRAISAPGPTGQAGLESFFQCLELALLYLRHGRHFLTSDMSASHALDDLQLTHLTRIHKGDGLTASPQSPSAPDSVDVILRVGRNVEVHHMADLGDVQAARGDVRSHQHLDAAGAK